MEEDMEIAVSAPTPEKREGIWIKTKAVIEITRNPKVDDKKIHVPPSPCTVTLHDRFTKLLCKLQKKHIDLGYEEINIPNTLMGRLERLKYCARLASSPYLKPSQIIKSKNGLHTKKSFGADVFDDLEEIPHPVVPGESKSLFTRYMEGVTAKPDFCTGPHKNRDELDNEIDHYWDGYTKRDRSYFLKKDVEMKTEKDDTNEESNFIYNESPKSVNARINGKIDDKKPANLFSKFWNVIKSRSEFATCKNSLDEDLDNYFNSDPRKNLDDDLENYRKQDPRLQDKDDLLSVATLDGEDRDEDFDDI